jgi:peptidoglycan/xylan/chitin deacetylase (PgdA/CDA1 family)
MGDELAGASSGPRGSGNVSRPGGFMLTFDTELIWGSFDHVDPATFERLYPDIRGTIQRILALLERYEVSATWAVVGHLFLTGCTRSADGLAHSELPRPRQSWRPGDWYDQDPCTDRARDPLWYGEDVLDLLQAARVPQEIGSHSFAHVLYGDPELSRAAVDAELDACLRLASARGIKLRSFVFPRNSEGHHQALAEHGFKVYRGADPNRFGSLPRPLRRPVHLMSHALGTAPPVSHPYEMLPGLWNVPGSALFLHRTGARRIVGRPARLRKARAGLRAAVETGGVFHLWTHPFNIASDPGYLLDVLETIVVEAIRLRDQGRLTIDTMGSVSPDP